MTAGQWTFTNGGRAALITGEFDLDDDNFAVALLDSTSNIGASTTTFAGVTGELGTANGYTAGGEDVTLSVTGTTTVTVALAEPVVWEAASGDITARYACLYKKSGLVLAYCVLDDAPADVTVTDGNTLTIEAGTVFTLS